MLSQDQVNQAVTERGSKIATVVFIKADGTERTINGMFKPTSHMKCGDAPRKLAPGQIPIWALSEKKWKSFKDDRVVEIR